MAQQNQEQPRRRFKLSSSDIIAGCAALFAGLSWWEAHQGAEVAEKQASAAADTASAAKKQAKAADDLVGVSQLQTKASLAQADAERAQAQAATAQAAAQGSQARSGADLVRVQRQLAEIEGNLANATERVQLPQLSLLLFRVTTIKYPPIQSKATPNLIYEFSNTGGSALTLLSDERQIITADALPPFPKNLVKSTLTKVVVGVGVTWGTSSHPDQLFITDDEAELLNRGVKGLYLFEKFTYLDKGGGLHVQKFALKARFIGYNAETADQVGGDDYNNST